MNFFFVSFVPFVVNSLLQLACGLGPTLYGDSVGRWVFDQDRVQGNRVEDLVGDNDATIDGPVSLKPDLPAGALLIDRDQSDIRLQYAPASTGFPKQAMTVEAWVAVEKTVEWGGIIGIVQETRHSDRGWILGFQQSSFSFGLATEEASEGGAGLTQVRSRSSLDWGRWYHVVGTYDGQEQRIYVNGELENSSTVRRGAVNYPEKASYLVGAYVDGENFRHRSWVHEIQVYDHALDPEDVAKAYGRKRALFPGLIQIKVGPVLERLDRASVRIFWETHQPCMSALAWGDTLPLKAPTAYGDDPTTEHEVTIRGVEPERMYHYRIFSASTGGASSSRLFEFDSTFDYTTEPLRLTEPLRPNGAGVLKEHSERASRVAERVLASGATGPGWCLILGCETGELAYQIATRTQLKVVCVEDDAGKVAAVRERLDDAGLYGIRVSVHQGSLESLAYTDYLANVVLSERTLVSGRLTTPASEVFRLLRPAGGVAILGAPEGTVAASGVARDQLQEWLAAGGITDASISAEDGLWVRIHRPALPGGGAWSHQYGDAGNSSSSEDELAEGRLRVLWFGRPGPRPMVDRGTRSPAPLSVNGRLFIQGDRRLFALDAYNGTILWTLEIPDLRRANVPRDSSNMVASEDSLYITVHDRCWRLAAATGDLLATFQVPRSESEDGESADVGEVKTTASHAWGYLACVGDTLFGSAVKHGGLYVGADGEWYDKSNEESHKVVSDYLFALHRKTGVTKWIRNGGLVVNSTIATGDGKLYMVETRSPVARKVKAGRMGKELTTDRYLVALDAQSGEQEWDQYYDFDEGRFVFYLSYARDTLVALSTSDKYHAYAFNARDGDLLWKKSYDWNRDHHGGAMQHPVILGDVVYAEPMAFGLRTGDVVQAKIPARRGCGALSGSKSALFFRDRFHSMWDMKSGQRQNFEGIRPGCWLSIIPAGGIVLAPETSAGCYCANPIQTSVAFLPIRESG